ncbi:MAG: methylenetetrahydrofolate--tRNA-(uracil(54)-C(5))-methyltransferase (FADH(2)-oxidizing) TrmFO [Clostridia bacterium]
MNNTITIIGGGLAGSEAAYQIAKRGIKVKLYEMKPTKYSDAHNNPNLAEIVCSNSFKSNSITNACGLLKEELRMLDSLLIKIADQTAVPAGQALAVDREIFAKQVTEQLEKMENIEIIREEVSKIPENGIVIIATGPLTSDNLSKEISKITGQDKLYFYDAAAPIVSKDSINMNIAFYGDRYGKGEANYINLPMNKEQYEAFYQALVHAEVIELHEFEKREIFEGCMPIEVMAKRGEDTIRFGPLKPVGFTNPHDGSRPYAVVQLRQDNQQATIYNLVGFQTNLKFAEQKRVFSMIPGLENAEFIKYGVMHRNTFINSPQLLNNTYQLKEEERIYFAGQITGVEGYVESISSGLLAGINAANQLQGKTKVQFSKTTMIGCLAQYIATENEKFQPMNANFGILPELEEKIRDKKLRYEKLASRAIEEIRRVI